MLAFLVWEHKEEAIYCFDILISEVGQLALNWDS
jgi:hypothetical protein